MKYRFLVMTMILLGSLIVACDDEDDGDSDSPQATVTVEASVTAEEVLEKAEAEAAKVTSFHFVLSHENGSTPLPLGLQLESAEGDVEVPDGIKAEVEAEAAGINVDVDIIGTDGRTWVTNPFTRDWQELDGTNIQDFADPAALLSELLPALKDPELTGETTLDGVRTYALTGTIDSGTLSSALGEAEPGHDVRVEAWIGVEDSLPRRVRIIGPLTDAEEDDVARQLDLSNFNAPVTIEPPE